MAFQPSTYAGQYPPLTPRSPSDVSSFDLLHTSLRAIPELAREGDKILNEEMLAKLVDGVRRFQCDHLGRKAKSKYWPTLRLPSTLFSDRSSQGPMATAILSAFRIKQTSPWRNFNFDNPKLFDDNISIIKRMEVDLYNRGFLKRPVIYFDSTVEEGLGPVEVMRLTKIAQRFGASVVDAFPNKKVTHVVAYDPEEHDAKDVIEEEERREKGGEEIERTYLKTLVVVDVPLEDVGDGVADGLGAGGGGGGEDATSSAIGKTKKMALVHWWYHPSSYDEWMAAEDVSGDVEQPFHPGMPGGPAVVGCKFVRDVEKFNEWGVEADYAVMEYERKIAYLRKEPNKSTSSSKRSNKKRRSSAKSESFVVNDTNTSSNEPTAKRNKLQKEDDHDGTNNAASPLENKPLPSPTHASPDDGNHGKSKSSSSSKSSNNASSGVGTVQRPAARQASDRRRPEGRTGGMNPRRILTGVRGGRRSEILRRTVHDGALRVEEEPHRMVKDALMDYVSVGDGAAENGGTMPSRLRPPTLGARSEWRKLLPPTGFVRPSVDAKLGRCMTVTELTASMPPASKEGKSSVAEGSKDGEGTASSSSTVKTSWTTVAAHRSVPILVLPKMGVEVGESDGGAPLSIRGGGDGGLEGEERANAGAGTDVGSDAPPQPKDEAANEVNLPTEGGNDDVAQPVVGRDESTDITMEEVGNVTSTPTSASVGAHASASTPVEKSMAGSKDDAMQVDEPIATVEESAAREGEVEEPPEKPSDGGVKNEAEKSLEKSSGAAAAAGEEGGAPRAVVVGGDTPKAPLPHAEPMTVVDSSTPPAAAEGGGDIEEAPKNTLSQAPAANGSANNASDDLKPPCQTATLVVSAEGQAASTGKQLSLAAKTTVPETEAQSASTGEQISLAVKTTVPLKETQVISTEKELSLVAKTTVPAPEAQSALGGKQLSLVAKTTVPAAEAQAASAGKELSLVAKTNVPAPKAQAALGGKQLSLVAKTTVPVTEAQIVSGTTVPVPEVKAALGGKQLSLVTKKTVPAPEVEAQIAPETNVPAPEAQATLGGKQLSILAKAAVPAAEAQNAPETTGPTTEVKSALGGKQLSLVAKTAVPATEAQNAPETAVPVTEVQSALGGKQLSLLAKPPAPATEAQIATTVATTSKKTQVAPSMAPASTAAAEVSSSTSIPTPAVAASKKQQPPSAASLRVAPLPPGTQLSSSLYRPLSTTTADEDAAKPNLVAAPAWYDASIASDLERRSLPEWFNGTAPHRTATTFVATREKILELAKGTGHQCYITATAIRRCVAGDAGSLLRLFNFLVGWGLLNGGNVGETTPADALLRGLRRAPAKRKHSLMAGFWSTSRMRALETSVVQQVSSKQTAPDSRMDIDWGLVAADVGDGASAAECQLAFLEPPTKDATLIADASSGSNNSTMLPHILDGVRPQVLKATIEASLAATSNLTEARKASLAAVVAHAAAARGAAAEAEAERTLMDIVDQRVQRLENRAALLDDVEALLEAERVSLELERRDMYTARCRHWFGDGSS